MSKKTRQKSHASLRADKRMTRNEVNKIDKEVAELENQISALKKGSSQDKADAGLIEQLRTQVRDYLIVGKSNEEIRALITTNFSQETLNRLPADVVESILSKNNTANEEVSEALDELKKDYPHLVPTIQSNIDRANFIRQKAKELNLVPGNDEANLALAQVYMEVLALDSGIKPNSFSYHIEKIVDRCGARPWRYLFSKLVTAMDQTVNGSKQRLTSATNETIKAQQEETGYYHPLIRKAFAEINDIIDSDLSDTEIVDPILKAMEVGTDDLDRIRMMKTVFRDEILPENRERLGALVDEVNLRVKKRETQQEDARAVDVIFAWVRENDFSVIQKNEVSRAYKLAESMLAKNMLPMAYNRTMDDLKVMAEGMMNSPAIVVKHNWAQALGNLYEREDKTISIKLPYPTRLFEFMAHGKCVIVMASEQPDGTVGYLHFVEFEKDRWFECHRTDPELETMMVGLRQQIEAICVALDSEIADTTENHPPEALNKKRLKAGKLPLRSYRVVDLSKRFRNKRSVAEGESGRSVRLHWRRGHWRHYLTHRIWINWMLVGNVDLGFVDKHYLA